MEKRDCINADELTRYLEDLLEAAARRRVEEHLSRCRGCRKRLVAGYESRVEPAVTAAPDELTRRARALVPRRWWREPRRRTAIAALLIAGLALSVVIFEEANRDPKPGSETLRARPAEALQLVAPSAGEVLGQGWTNFRWRPVQEARRYTLSVVDPLGEIVHRVTTTEPAAEVATEVFDTDRDYYWYVSVLLEDGTSLESEVRGFSRRR